VPLGAAILTLVLLPGSYKLLNRSVVEQEIGVQKQMDLSMM